MDWSYIAGLFDGDGSVAIAGKREKSGKLSGVYIVINITSINRKFLSDLFQWFKEQKVNSCISSPKTRTPKVQIASSSSIRRFIECVLPYAHLKKRHLEIIQDALDLKDQLKNDKTKTIGGNLHLFNVLRTELHSLALKGPKTLAVW